jgi:drug/metabolite transporter (DMT)-like permease
MHLVVRLVIYTLFLAFTAINVAGGAVSHQKQHLKGIGEIANNIEEPVTLLANFVGAAAIAIGCSFVFSALVKYMRHRVNPYEVPISTVVVLLIMGILLLCLPLAYKLTESGFPLSL